MRMRKRLLNFANFMIKPSGFEIRRRYRYVDMKAIVRGARRSGQTICEYVENEWEAVGLIDFVMNKLNNLEVLIPCREVVEIGPGTGIYMDRQIQKIMPERYHIYELDEGCSKYLSKKHEKVIAHSTDGHSLDGLSNGTCGFCVAHGVFLYLSLLNCFRYFHEMIRVCQAGGHIAFDIFSDREWKQEIIDVWIPLHQHNWPVILPEQKVIDFFARNGCNLIDRFNAQTGFDFSTYVVFKKMKA